MGNTIKCARCGENDASYHVKSYVPYPLIKPWLLKVENFTWYHYSCEQCMETDVVKIFRRIKKYIFC